MLNLSDSKKRDWLEEFDAVSALYMEARNDKQLRPRKAITMNREVPVKQAYDYHGLDFVCDVEIKAKRVLPPNLFVMFKALAEQYSLHLLPEPAKIILGKCWKEYKLGVDGHYAVVHFVLCNGSPRAPFVELPAVPTAAKPTLEQLDRWQ
jgi:hypothetical protein